MTTAQFMSVADATTRPRRSGKQNSHYIITFVALTVRSFGADTSIVISTQPTHEHTVSDTHKLTNGQMKKFHATATHRIVRENRPRLNGPLRYSGLSSYRQRPSTGRIYPIWPASVEPEKNASNAVSDPIEITPNAAEVRNTKRDALFGVCVRGETRESQSEKGRARSRAYAKKMREAATN